MGIVRVKLTMSHFGSEQELSGVTIFGGPRVRSANFKIGSNETPEVSHLAPCLNFAQCSAMIAKAVKNYEAFDPAWRVS